MMPSNASNPAHPENDSASAMAEFDLRLDWLAPEWLQGIEVPQFCAEIGQSLLIGGLTRTPAGTVAVINRLLIETQAVETVFRGEVVTAATMPVAQHLSIELGFLAHACCEQQGQSMLAISLVSLQQSLLLLTLDGKDFKTLPNPPDGSDLRHPFGTLIGIGDRLVGAALGSLEPHQETAADNQGLVASVDGLERWSPVSPRPLGCAGGRVIQCLAADAGRLIAAIGNPLKGFEIRVAQVDDANAIDASLQWRCVIDQGAHRYTENSCVSALCPHQGAVYIATGGLGPGFNQGQQPVLAPPELIKLDLQAEAEPWELISGQPRFSPEALRVPTLALGPGLGHPEMAVHSHLLTSAQGLIVSANQQRGTQSTFALWQLPNDGQSAQLMTKTGFGLSGHWLSCLEQTTLGLIGLTRPWGVSPDARPAAFCLNSR